MITPERHDRMVELFTAASKLPPDERDAFLDQPELLAAWGPC